MMYVPEFVALYEITPFIILASDNESIRVAVKYYRKGGKKKAAIIKKYGKMEDWNTTNVTDMSNLFHKYDYYDFNEDISKWDTSSVTTMEYMFKNCKYFNQDISGWNVSKVIDMESMFEGAESFNQSIGDWNVSFKQPNPKSLWNVWNYTSSKRPSTAST